MGVIDIFIFQIGDPLRLLLMIAVLAIQLRTGAIVRREVAWGAGIVVVAALIPILLPNENVHFLAALAIGLLTNALMLAVIVGVWAVLRRFKH